ncbi:polysaccharide biosynthesis protein [Halobacteriales archaeon QS_1_68_20]|nr:MAG: polysaccharide biosynthesis protein [Halobacteriales archaeon QS_1_68_20]
MSSDDSTGDGQAAGDEGSGPDGDDETTAADVSLGGETAKATVAKFLMAAAGFAGSIFFARYLGPVAFGGFYLLFSVVKLSDRPLAGVSKAGKKRFSEADADRSEILGTQLLASLAWALLASAVAVAAADWLRSYTGLPSAPLLFAVLLIAVGLFEPLDKLVKARGKVGAATWADAVRSYLTLPLQVGFVLAGFGAAGMAYGLSAATLTMVPVMWWLLGTRPTFPDRETVASVWRFARYSIPQTFLGKAYADFDRVILGLLLAPGAVGLYVVAAQLTMPAMFVAAVAAEGLMARVSHSHSRGEAVAGDVTNTLSFASLLSVPIFFGALAIARPIVVTVYGGEYAAAATLLIGLALYQILRTQRAPLSRTLGGLDRPNLNLWIAAVTLAFNVVVGVWLVLRVGVVGVVVATVLAESLQYLATAALVKRAVPEVSLLPRALLEQVAAGAVMFVAVSLVHTVVAVRSWFDLGVLLGVGGVVYFAVLLAASGRFRVTVRSVLEDLGITLPI